MALRLLQGHFEAATHNYSCLLPLEQIAAPEGDSSLGAAGVTERSCGRSRGVAVGGSCHINEDSMRNSKTQHWQQPCLPVVMAREAAKKSEGSQGRNQNIGNKEGVQS